MPKVKSYDQASNSKLHVHTILTTYTMLPGSLLKESDALGSKARERGPSYFKSFSSTKWHEVPFFEILLIYYFVNQRLKWQSEETE